jgi:hypothetical protein
MRRLPALDAVQSSRRDIAGRHMRSGDLSAHAVLGLLAKHAGGGRVPVISGETRMSHIDIVFDGPPSHESGRFVEVEDADGKSINLGEWVHRPDGYWVLRIQREALAAPDDVVGEIVAFIDAYTEQRDRDMSNPAISTSDAVHISAAISAARYLRDAIASRFGSGDGWNYDMESAPRDGTAVDLWYVPRSGSPRRLPDMWLVPTHCWRNGDNSLRVPPGNVLAWRLPPPPPRSAP